MVEPYTDEMIASMTDLYLYMDIDAHIQQMLQYTKMSEQEIADMRKSCEEMKAHAKNGTIREYFQRVMNYDTAGSGEWAQFPIKDFPDNSMMRGYDPKNEEATAEWALDLASDMASATVFNCITPELMKAAGLAVSEYPHPLVLNNYAGLLRGDSPVDSLFFYFVALEMEPQNPIILTNIAMAYLDMGSLNTAIGYADEALRHNPECGPALQIKTIGHLKDGNSILAAETLFKSTRDSFDDMTILLFENYLEAVSELDPFEDDFPINDSLLEELYQMARKYVDTADVNESVDSPAAQLSMEGYPSSFSSAEDILLSLNDYGWALYDKHSKRIDELTDKIRDLRDKRDPRGGGPETLTVINNKRQEYAYKVLESYYDFYYKKEYSKDVMNPNDHNYHIGPHEIQYDIYDDFVKELKELWDHLRDSEEAIWEAMENDERTMLNQELEIGEQMSREREDYYQNKKKLRYIGDSKSGYWHEYWDEADTKAHEAATKRFSDEINRLSKEIEKRRLTGRIEFYEKTLVDMDAVYNLVKHYASMLMEKDRDWYYKSKQILEEFWLKAGGLIKYMTEDDLLELCEAQREKFVLRRADVNMAFSVNLTTSFLVLEDRRHGGLSGLWDLGPMSVKAYYEDREKILDELESLRQKLGELTKRPDIQKPPRPIDFDYERDDPVNIEGTALQNFEKPNHLNTIGFSAFGSYVYFNDAEASWKLPFIGRGKADFINETVTKYEDMRKRERPRDMESITVGALDVSAKFLSKTDMVDKLSGWEQKIRGLDDAAINTGLKGSSITSGIGKLTSEGGKIVSGVGFLRAAADVKRSGEITIGKYVTKDSKGRVIDHGIVYERQVGGSIIDIELASTTTVMHSKITNVATKTMKLEYKFKFMSISN
jgi:hypothetical protein